MLIRSQSEIVAPVNGQKTAVSPARRASLLTSKWNWLLVIPLLLFATWLTARELKGAFWVDEVITVQRAGSPINGGPFSPAQIWENTATTSYDQVPGYYMLVGIWDNLLGWSEYSTRLLSLMFGLLGAALTYRLGRAIHSPLAGLAAAAVLVSSEHFIKFAHEGRTYELLILLGALAIWCYWRILRGRHSWLVQGGLLLAAAGLLYSHYFAALLVFSICLYHLIFVSKTREWWRVVVIMGIAGVLFLPWFLTSFNAINGANSEAWRQAMSMTFPELSNELLGFFSNGSLALLLIVGAFTLQFRQRSDRLLWFLFLCPVLLGFIVNLWIGMLVSSKFYLYLWVPMALLFGIGTARIFRKGLQPAYILVPVLLVGTWTNLTVQEDPIKYIAWDVLHEQLVGQTRADDSVIFHLQATEWDGAHKRGVDYYFHDFPKVPDLVWSWPHVTDEVYLNGVRAAEANVQRIWSSYDPLHKPALVDTIFIDELAKNDFADCGRVVDTEKMGVDLFARPPKDGFTYTFGTDTYDHGIQMALMGGISESRQGWILVPLGWQASSEIPVNTYSYAVHVLDS